MPKSLISDEWDNFVKEHGTGLHHWTLQKTMKSKPYNRFKYYQNNPFLIRNFGCEKCALKEHCPIDEKDRKTGICRPRAQMFGAYLREGHGETIPLMKDHLSKLMMERDLEEARWRAKGLPPTNQWLVLNSQLTKLMEKIHQCEKGIKVEHQDTILDDMRATLMIDTPDKRIIVQQKEQKGDKDESDSGESDRRAEAEIRTEV